MMFFEGLDSLSTTRNNNNIHTIYNIRFSLFVKTRCLVLFSISLNCCLIFFFYLIQLTMDAYQPLSVLKKEVDGYLIKVRVTRMWNAYKSTDKNVFVGLGMILLDENVSTRGNLFKIGICNLLLYFESNSYFVHIESRMSKCLR